MKVVLSERAIADITHIHDQIAAVSPPAAQRVEDLIRSTCEGLGDFPYASAATDEPRIRRVPLVRYPYTIFFRANDSATIVEIARVVHAARIKSLGQMPE